MEMFDLRDLDDSGMRTIIEEETHDLIGESNNQSAASTHRRRSVTEEHQEDMAKIDERSSEHFDTELAPVDGRTHNNIEVESIDFSKFKPVKLSTNQRRSIVDNAMRKSQVDIDPNLADEFDNYYNLS